MKNRRPTRTFVITAVLGLALLSLAPLAAQARGKGGQPPSPEQAVERMTRRLDLTAEQQDKVQAILGESFEARRDMREQHRQEGDVMRDATDAQLAEVLTAKQMNELRDLREHRQDRQGDRRGDRRRGCDQSGERGNCGKSATN